MDEGLSAAVVKAFVDLHKQGLIYRDKRLVNWDCQLQTAVSDLEVAQQQTNGHLWHFKYPIEGTENEYITIATTRPSACSLLITAALSWGSTSASTRSTPN